MSPDLPADLRLALDRLVDGRPRGDIARRATAISDTYRGGGGSDVIRGPDDALAYALARLPATYAAIAAVLSALDDVLPDFAPSTLLDVGAGPGTAAFAAAQRYGALQRVTLLDHNPHLRDLGLTLLAASDRAALRAAVYDRGEAAAGPATNALADLAPADLVLASYVIGEIGADRLAAFADALWSHAESILVVVEPGTTAGFNRIAALRAHLIAAGAHVAAPCPHERPCPIVAPDWCHFVQRLNRSRAHRHVKAAELSYEDEKFAYVVLAREKPARAFDARVLAPPDVSKVAVTARLCRQDGAIATATAPRRDRAAYKAAKGWRWGDALTRAPGEPDR